MIYMHELSRAVQADREREIRDRLRRTPGLASGSRHPSLPHVGVDESGLRRIELRREQQVAFGS